MKPLKGIIPPLVTPLLGPDQLDVDGLTRLIEHTIAGGVHGLFILGTTGEFSSLSYRLRHELIERTCRVVNRRIPVLVGVADSSYIESINLSEKAAKEGADAVVITPPFYFSQGQAELLEYLQHIVPQLALPVFLYNMPVHTKVMIEPETAIAAAEMPQVLGMKDSSSNLAYFKLIQYGLKHRPDFSLLVGPEELTSEFVVMGGHGGVNGGANMFPRLYVDLYNASVERDFDKILPLQNKVMQICSTIYRVGKYGSSYLKGVKSTLSLLGICSDFMAEPFHKFNQPEREKIKKFLEEIQL